MSADNILESVLNRLMTDQGNNRAVLYVDSCESSLRAFRLVCSEQFRVLTASSGLEGLAQLNEHKDEIGVVVVARCMPICGQHGGGPTSIKFCRRAGLSHVSCSPNRVPIARLSAAQAAIEYRRDTM